MLPGVPPLADTLPGFELIVFFGLYVPKGADPAIIQALYQAARAAAERDEFKRSLAGQGFEIGPAIPPSSPHSRHARSSAGRKW